MLGITVGHQTLSDQIGEFTSLTNCTLRSYIMTEHQNDVAFSCEDLVSRPCLLSIETCEK